MVDSDFSKYDGFKDSLQGILYPAYALVQTLVLIIYFVPHILLPLMIMVYFSLKSQSRQKPIDNVISEIRELDDSVPRILTEYVNGLAVIKANSKQQHYAAKLTKLYN
jgi:hypothetical protein